MAFIFAGTGLPTLAAGLISDRRSVEADAPFVISLEPLEPKIAARRDGDSPVILPGYLLPADLSEESSDGGH